MNAQRVVVGVDVGPRGRFVNQRLRQRWIGIEVRRAQGDDRPRRRRLSDQRHANPGCQLGALGHDAGGAGGRAEVHEAGRVAAVMHPIVDEEPVATSRDAMQAGVEERLGRDRRILLVGQVVAGVGEEFDQRHTEIGG